MKNVFSLLISMFFIIALTGCNLMSKEENEEIDRIKKETKLVMIEYLQENYNIANVSDVTAVFYPGDSTFGNSFEDFTGYVAANFKKNNVNYAILCEYDTRKCYDAYAYEVKVNPILVDYLNNVLREYDSNFDANIDYAALYYEEFPPYYRYNAFNDIYYGVFNNYDDINTIEKIWNYFDSSVEQINVIYNISEKFIAENFEAYNYLQEKLNVPIFIESYYDNGLESEHLETNGSSYFECYINEMVEVGNYIIYRQHVIYRRRGGVEYANKDVSQVKYGEFEVDIVKNGTLFEPAIELYQNTYKLYSSDILKIKNVGEGEIIDNLYFLSRDTVCRPNKIIYNKFEDSAYVSSVDGTVNSINNEYVDVSSYGGEELNSVRYFAIYCKSE